MKTDKSLLAWTRTQEWSKNKETFAQRIKKTEKCWTKTSAVKHGSSTEELFIRINKPPPMACVCGGGLTWSSASLWRKQRRVRSRSRLAGPRWLQRGPHRGNTGVFWGTARRRGGRLLVRPWAQLLEATEGGRGRRVGGEGRGAAWREAWVASRRHTCPSSTSNGLGRPPGCFADMLSDSI